MRNEFLFHDKAIKISEAVQLVKFRSLSWGLALGLILKETSVWWDNNPSGVAVASLRSKWYNLLMEENCTIAALIDGSWKAVGSSFKGGIGGVVKSKEGVRLLEFAGPVKVQSAIQAEVQALLQLVSLLVNSQWSKEKILILLDSVNLINAVRIQPMSADWEKLRCRIALRHVNRFFNIHADKLAKYGASLNKIWINWAST